MSMTNGGPPAGGPSDAANQAQPSLNVLAQYVKDLSFENPNAPNSLTQQPGQQPPKINIQINVNAKPLAGSDFEVELKIEGRAELPTTTLFAFDLLYAGYALPFLDADAFGRFWRAARDRLRPGGVLVVNFFGPRDSWVGREGMSFIDVEAVRRLVEGLEVLALDEEDQDGNSFLGPKHWHVFDVIVRRPSKRIADK